MTDWATAEAVEEAAEAWTDQQVECRIYGHNWRAQTVTHRPGQYTVTQRCPRCRVRRWQRISESGYPLSPWHADYSGAPTYLLKNKGRMGQDGKAVLRLRNFTVVSVIEEADE